jgi:hypothetical protein
MVEAIPLLINIATHNTESRQSVATALAMIGSVKAITPLMQYVYDDKEGEYHTTSTPRIDNALYSALQSLAKQHHFPELNKWLDHLIAQDDLTTNENEDIYDEYEDEKNDTADKVEKALKALTPQQLLAQLTNTKLYRTPRIKALDQLMKSEPTLAKQALLTLVKDKANDAIIGRRLYLYLAELKATDARPLIETRLETLTREWQQWRMQRDQLTQDASENTKQKDVEALEVIIQIHEDNKPTDFAYTYANTIARLAPQQGISLLEHPLAEARRGAWEGLAMLADVALVKQLDQQRALKKDNPIFYHAAYRAIDLSLIHIDAKSHAEDRDALDAYLKNGVVDQQAVAPRIEWTRDRISETLVNLKRMEEQLAHWFDSDTKNAFK